MDTSSPQPSNASDMHAPLTSASPSDQTSIIAILTGFALGLILLSTGVRLHARRYSGVFRPDDCAFYFAVFFALTQTGFVFYLVSEGLGKTVDSLRADELESVERVSTIQSDGTLYAYMTD